MVVETTLRELDFADALQHVDHGAAFVDLRPVDPYLEVHIPGSLALFYEAGPGMASRARDCLPLEVSLILLDLGHGDMVHAAASLRGKGFNILGGVHDGINRWARTRGAPVSMEIVQGNPIGRAPSSGETLILDVGDPLAGTIEGATRIPIEQLWLRVSEVTADRVVVASGPYGVRAALAVGILERAGIRNIIFWKP